MDKIAILKQQATFHLLTFLSRNRDRWTRWIINTALFAAGIIVAGMWMSITHPSAGEILQNQLITLFLTAVTIAAAGLGLAIARGVWLSTPELARDMLPPISFRERYYLVFGKELRWRLPTFGQKVLPVSTWTPPDAGRDILVCSLPGEGPEQFADRMDEAIEQANVARWVLVMQQGNPNGVIYGAPDAVSKFFRDWPPFQTEKWLHEQRIVPAGTRFIGETETEFQDYVERFMLHFPEWSLRKKMSGEENRSGFVFQQIVKAASVIFFLLFSVSTFAQKTEKVSQTPIGNSTPESGTEVSYIFQKTDLYRTGNGKATYAELLKNVPGYRDGGGGELLAIMADGKSVYKASQTGDVAGQPATKAAAMRPYSEAVNPDGLGDSGFSMPDSNRMRDMANRVQVEFDHAGRQVVGAARPWFDTLNFIFIWLYPFLVLVGGVCYLWAYVTAKQGMYDMHRAAMRALTWVALITATVALVNALVFAFSLNLHPIGLTLIAACEVALIVYLTHKFIPDFRPSAGNDPRRSGFGYNNNNPQLNG